MLKLICDDTVEYILDTSSTPVTFKLGNIVINEVNPKRQNTISVTLT